MGILETERLTLDLALEAVGRETGLVARVLHWEPRLGPDAGGPDALIEVAGPQGTHPFAVEIKNNLDRFETLHQLKTFWPRDAKDPLLVIAPYFTPQMAERCHELEMCFADTAGNVYLRAPGLHIYVKGKRKPLELIKNADEGRTINPAGLKIVFALLCQPRLLNATYREIAATARVALGTVGPVVKGLEKRRHLTALPGNRPNMQRRFLEPRRLLQEWVAVYPAVLRPKLNVRRFHAPRPDWTKRVDLAQYGALWGGEVAANRLLHHLQPQAATVYTREPPTRLIVDQRLKADGNGDVEILDVFWNTEQVPTIRDVVPPILAFADLMTTTDGRNLEAAKMIYEEYVEPALKNQT